MENPGGECYYVYSLPCIEKGGRDYVLIDGGRGGDGVYNCELEVDLKL